MTEGDHRLGPSLHAIVGKKAGAAQGFSNYSPGFKNTDVVWDEGNLDKFIVNPEQLFSGTNMKPFSGVTDAAERKKIIDYLKSAK